jgi:hypothetical protein
MTVNVWDLSDLCTPWCVHVVVTLRIANQLEAGPRSITDLALAAACDADSLRRVLRHLIEKGVFEEPNPGCFALNDAARGLLDSGMQLGMDLDGFGGRMAYAWSSMLTAVRTGKPAYHTVFGRPFWEDLAAHPELSEQFDELMGVAGHGVPDPEIELAGGWGEIRTVVDVGGGTGALLAELLQVHPHVRGTLVDLPATVERSGSVFLAAGVADRVTLAGQSFFDPLPPGADLYLIKNVLSDWPDPEATALLRRCAEAAGSTGRVVVLSGVGPDDPGGPSPELLMMVLVGGRARTLSEFRRLAQTAGLQVTAAGRQRTGRFVVECRVC